MEESVYVDVKQSIQRSAVEEVEMSNVNVRRTTTDGYQ